ncbi:MAG: helix-turn-helix domain-containing protein [Planctomycetia bacterium]
MDSRSDELLTRQQAAALLGLNPHTLACWRTEGRGPALVKFGAGRSAAIRYARSAIEAWLADPVAAEAAAREPWREARRQAMASKAVKASRPAKRRRARARA